MSAGSATHCASQSKRSRLIPAGSTATLTVGGESFASTLSYDTMGRVSAIVYPSLSIGEPFAVNQVRDAYGHLMGAVDAVTGTPYWTLSGVDDAGRVTGETFGNGAVTTRGYYADKERVASIATVGGADDMAYDPQRHQIYVSGGEGFVSIIKVEDADHYREIGRLAAGPGAKTSLFVPEFNSIYVAIPAQANQPAVLEIFKASN